MKVFKFNPVTGKKGELICSMRKISYTAESAKFMIDNGHIEPFDFNFPKETASSKWVVHVDAGYRDNSYLDDQWICMCMGQWSHNGQWQWIILPPKDLIKSTTEVK